MIYFLIQKNIKNFASPHITFYDLPISLKCLLFMPISTYDLARLNCSYSLYPLLLLPSFKQMVPFPRIISWPDLCLLIFLYLFHYQFQINLFPETF